MSNVVAIIYVRKEGVEHFERMLAWLRDNVGTGNFQWFGYNMSHKTHTMIHFYNKEAAVAFMLAWNGKTHDRG